jgi:hypothetical protein
MPETRGGSKAREVTPVRDIQRFFELAARQVENHPA